VIENQFFMKIHTNPIFLLLTLFLFSNTIFSANIKNTDTIKEVSTTVKYFNDDIVAARLDELAVSVLFKGKNIYADTSALNIHKFKPSDVPQYTDEQYRAYFKKMSALSPFPFTYNEDVRKFIDLYAQKRRPLTSRLLGLAAYYFPLFEEKLDKYNLPLELKYLAVIESALNPVAVSRAGASGLWQFMYNTGKLYKLEVNSYVDDRIDPFKATTAACELFVDLYKVYNDWALVLAAYNSGSGSVNKAIRKAGGAMDYWTIRKFMPRETQSYVPVYIAAAFVLSHAAEFNLYPVYPGYLFTKTDTVTIKEKISFDQISEALNIPVEELVSLNPCFKKNIIPSCNDLQYKIKLPYNKVGEFVVNENEIYNFKTLDQLIKEDYAARNNIKSVYTESHTVKKGETISTVARKCACTVDEIKKWNKLKSATVHPGQKLIVSNSTPQIVLPKPPTNTTNEFCVVGSNETLRDIAKKHECTVDNLRLWNNIRNLDIAQGQQLVIHIPIIEPVKETNILETTAAVEVPAEKTEIVETKAVAPSKKTETSAVAINETKDSVSDTSNIKVEVPKQEVKKEAHSKYVLHVVQKGDTLWNIAQRYNIVSVEDIKKLNSLKDSILKPGQKLKLPVKG